MTKQEGVHPEPVCDAAPASGLRGGEAEGSAVKREWYDHWRERPDRLGRTRDWLDCAHCAHKSVYRGLGVRVCAFDQQPADCGRYSYKFHPWLRADGLMWCHKPEPEQYDALGLPTQVMDRDTGGGGE